MFNMQSKFTACLLVALLALSFQVLQPVAPVVASAAPVITNFSASYDGTCAVVDGVIKCWGTNVMLPVTVTGFTGTPVVVVRGYYHACALNSDGAVYCWGSNESGQLGTGKPSLLESATPLLVSGLSSGVAALAAGGSHTCALLDDATVICWGFNGWGQLGDETYTTSYVPVVVSGLSNVTHISAGSDHSCAVSGGAAKCWGSNTYGQLGDDSVTTRSAPIDVSGLAAHVTVIEAGGYHTCAIVSGAAVCWGHNYAGQVGDGTKIARYVPTPVVGLETSVTHIRGGGYHTCAIVNGAAKCWGRNNYGQLGDGLLVDRSLPGDLSGISGITAFSLGDSHTCATEGGSLFCWGANPSGELGDGVRLRQLSPVTANDLRATSLLSAGGNTCAADGAGALFCWGSNFSGTVGNNTNVPYATSPSPVSGLTSGVQAVSVGYGHVCAVSAAGAAKCWGANNYGQLGVDENYADKWSPFTVFGLGSGMKSVAAGRTFSCGLTTLGAVKCWGDNASGQIGNGGTSGSYPLPQNVQGLNAGVKAIAAGADHACAIQSDDSLVCWGANYWGQLGNDNNEDQNTPVAVVGLSQVAAVDAGYMHTCALTSAGAVYCWGNNSDGQLGAGGLVDQNTPYPVTGLGAGITAISAGDTHNCAVTFSGTLKCWGGNGYGQVGNGNTINQRYAVDVPGLSGVLGAAAGTYHTCARTGGDVHCWGSNQVGQLGDGSALYRTAPYRVSGLGSGPELGVNYLAGKPGTVFRFVGTGYPVNSDIDVLVGGNWMGAVRSDNMGSFVFNLLTDTALPGDTHVEAAQGGLTANLTVMLAADGTLHKREGAAPSFRLSAARIYLPIGMK